MGAPRDLVWSYATPGSKLKFFKCTFCDKEMYGNPTIIKKHMLSESCTPPPDVRVMTKRAPIESARVSQSAHRRYRMARAVALLRRQRGHLSGLTLPCLVLLGIP